MFISHHHIQCFTPRREEDRQGYNEEEDEEAAEDEAQRYIYAMEYAVVTRVSPVVQYVSVSYAGNLSRPSEGLPDAIEVSQHFIDGFILFHISVEATAPVRAL